MQWILWYQWMLQYAMDYEINFALKLQYNMVIL